MGKNRRPSQKAVYRKMAKKPFGPWEERTISVTHPMRPVLMSKKEKWREENFLNNRYSVQISDVETDWGEVTHLWIRRHDDEPVRSWKDMQRVKNELVGKERTAVEVFPAESQLTDSANIYHLWVLPEDFVLPFTL